MKSFATLTTLVNLKIYSFMSPQYLCWKKCGQTLRAGVNAYPFYLAPLSRFAPNYAIMREQHCWSNNIVQHCFDNVVQQWWSNKVFRGCWKQEKYVLIRTTRFTNCQQVITRMTEQHCNNIVIPLLNNNVENSVHAGQPNVFQVPIRSVEILHICNLWILLRKIVINLFRRNFYLRGLFFS